MRTKTFISYYAAGIALLLGCAGAARGSLIWQEDFQTPLNPYGWGTAMSPAPPPDPGGGSQLSAGEYSTVGGGLEFKADRNAPSAVILYTTVLPRSLFQDGVAYSVSFDYWQYPDGIPFNKHSATYVKISTTGPDTNDNPPDPAAWLHRDYWHNGNYGGKATDGSSYFQYDFASNQNDLVLYLWLDATAEVWTTPHGVIDNIVIATGAGGGGSGYPPHDPQPPAYDYNNPPPPPAIPEPASAALWMLGALVLAMGRRGGASIAKASK